MLAAKEVGGDFYDFYRLEQNRVAFLVADVSGKGIPAAMFMMTAKTILKDLAESGLAVHEIFTRANEKLCQSNESGMFVTAWMGILDLDSGRLQYANAGHNPPLLLHQGEEFVYLKSRAGFVLAGMEGMQYRMQELMLEAGDRIFLYTDGVTEATNDAEELYGEDRLRQYMNHNRATDSVALLHGLKAEIDQFVGDAPQFDDITMLIFDFKKKGEFGMKQSHRVEQTFPAEVNMLPAVLEFVEQMLQEHACPMKTMMAISVAIEEVFVNIAKYAYGEAQGDVTMACGFDPAGETVTFDIIDQGIPFNPLERPDPDITLSAEEREIGGLGIFITKKTMDTVSYRQEHGSNVLTISKKIK